MSIAQVAAGLDPRDGGPAYSVPRLAAALDARGLRQTIHAVGTAPARPGLHLSPQDLARVPLARSLRLSRALAADLARRAASADLVHAHGLWLMPNVYAGQAASSAGKPLAVSPRGMLAPAALAFSRRRKQAFWHLFQRRAYAHAALWHATSAEEAADIRAFGIGAPIVLIPNGIDLPAETAPHADGKAPRTILFLSRLHPKKGIPDLIEAWRRLAPGLPGWQLIIAGPDEKGHQAELLRQIEGGAIPRVRFPGPVAGAAKEALLAGADLVVLPTLSENFGIVVAEALAAGVPAVVTKGAPWAGLVTEGAGWWIDHGPDALAGALAAATALPPAERRAMGQRGRAWMARDFAWDAIASQMAEAYRWAIVGGERPPCLVDG